MRKATKVCEMCTALLTATDPCQHCGAKTTLIPVSDACLSKEEEVRPGLDRIFHPYGLPPVPTAEETLAAGCERASDAIHIGNTLEMTARSVSERIERQIEMAQENVRSAEEKELHRRALQRRVEESRVEYARDHQVRGLASADPEQSGSVAPPPIKDPALRPWLPRQTSKLLPLAVGDDPDVGSQGATQYG